MIKQTIYYCLFFTISLTTVRSQNSVNQYDNDGKRHGLWTKNYHKTDQVRYRGVFRHGKEIDTFKYFTLSEGKSVLSATKVFNQKDNLSDVIFYASNKKVISEGQMNGRDYVGQWIYYHKNSDAKMIVENYNSKGELDGERIVYYKDGAIAEKTSYKNGKLDGEAKWYSEQKLCYRTSQYENDQLNGLTAYFDNKGKLSSQGHYKDDQKAGLWTYYEDGKLKKEIDHTNNIVVKKYE